MRDYLLISIGIICSIIALPRPVFGLLFFICLGFSNPQSMVWTIGRTIPLSLFVGIGTILGFIFGTEPKKFPGQREAFLLLILWGVFGLSTIFAIYPEAALERFVHVSKIFLMVFLSFIMINNKRRLHLLIRVISFSIGYLGIKGGLWAIITGGEFLVWGPENSFLYENNSIGLALVMNIPILFYLLKIETNNWIRCLIKIMLFFSFFAAIFTYSRGAWLGLATVIGLIILKSKYKLPIVFASIVIGFLVLPVISEFSPHRISDRFDTLVNYKDDESAQSRLLSWELCSRVGLFNPFHGGGFEFISEDIYEKYIPGILEAWSQRWGTPAKAWSCHSSWLTVLGEHGVLGGMLLVSLIISVFLSLKRLQFYGETQAGLSWIVPYINMLQVSFIAFIVVGSLIDAAYFDMFYYLIAVLIILKEIINNNTAGGSSKLSPILHGGGAFLSSKG